MSIDDAIFDMKDDIGLIEGPIADRLRCCYMEIVDHIADLEREKMEMTSAIMGNREVEFKDAFCAAFTAGYAARRYDSACVSGGHEHLERFLEEVGEDAELLAEAAWKGRANL